MILFQKPLFEYFFIFLSHMLWKNKKLRKLEFKKNDALSLNRFFKKKSVD